MDINDNVMIRITKDNLQAELTLVNDQLENIQYTKEAIVNCLKKYNITYGIQHDVIETLITNGQDVMLPVVIAKGLEKKDGTDASLNIINHMSDKLAEEKEWDFRDVMDIPTVKIDTLLATVTKETNGTDGMNVYGKTIKARKGRPIRTQAGKNVIYDEDRLGFFSTKEGQPVFSEKLIEVQDVYVVNETLSMKIGNIQFPGTVIIHGDVPSGFTIEADSDIKVFGIVEGATLKAKGSIYIAEGIAGIQQAALEAEVDVYARYINQGKVKALNNITVDHSILHSYCEAGNNIQCRVGNIIGGKIIAQNKVVAKDIGNRMHTETIVGILSDQVDASTNVATELTEIKENITKINTLIKNMENNKEKLTGQDRILLLRLKKSKHSATEKLKELEQKKEVHQIERDRKIVTNGKIYPNVTILFGKYETIIRNEVHSMTLTIERNEIKYIQRT